MGCSTCANKKEGVPNGCQSNGDCLSGACNRKNTFDWLNDISLPGESQVPWVEVSFSAGIRKGFYKIRAGYSYATGDWVIVEAEHGQDLGQISLSGVLVELQMKKKNFTNTKKSPVYHVLKLAQEKDMELLQDKLEREKQIMLKARSLARETNPDMKISDVELQADGKKGTFYYIADKRIDFRELIKIYASEFKLKIDMRQIGARQEAARIGGIGSCGRELCCSTWLGSFKSVSTSAARYQQLSINQTKLSGQCGRLKCCLNFELDSYMDALSHFPKKADRLSTTTGVVKLIKTDIFKQEMIYVYPKKTQHIRLSIDQVKEILALNAEGKKAKELESKLPEIKQKTTDFEDGVGMISLQTLEKTAQRRKRKKSGNKKNTKNRKT